LIDCCLILQLLDGPTEAHETEVAWKQGHVVKVVPYKQVWIDQEDAQVGHCHGLPLHFAFWQEQYPLAACASQLALGVACNRCVPHLVAFTLG
jgi:hypothetical protein